MITCEQAVTEWFERSGQVSCEVAAHINDCPECGERTLSPEEKLIKAIFGGVRRNIVVSPHQPGFNHWCPNDKVLFDFLDSRGVRESMGMNAEERRFAEEMEEHIKECSCCQQRADESLHVLFDHQLYDFIVGNISGEEADLFREHLEGCSFCKIRVKNWEEIWEE